MFSTQTLINFVSDHIVYAHLFIVLGVIIEGEFVMILGGVLAHIGALSFFEVLAFAYLGAIFKTFAWYKVGEFIRAKFSKSRFLKYMEGKIHLLLPSFKKKPFWSIFSSKFIYGVNHLTMIFSGYIGIKKKIFIKSELLSSIVWVGGLVSLGYFFSHTAFGMSHNIRKATIMIVAMVVAFVLLQRLAILLVEVISGRVKEQENGK